MPRKAKTGFIKSFDGTKLSYRIAGEGKETLLCFNGIGVAKWVWQPLEEFFADKYKIVTWDYRGHGLSDNPKDIYDASFEDLVKDSEEIIKQLKIKNSYFLGHSVGFHIALEAYRSKKSAAKGFISCLGTPGKELETFMESPLGQIFFDLGYILNAVLPSTAQWVYTNFLRHPATMQIGAALKLLNLAISGDKEIQKYILDLTDMNQTLFNQLVATGADKCANDILSTIKKPTLLIASENDKFVPLKIAKSMNKKIAKSELFVIKNGTHAALLEQPDIFNLCIERFIR